MGDESRPPGLPGEVWRGRDAKGHIAVTQEGTGARFATHWFNAYADPPAWVRYVCDHPLRMCLADVLARLADAERELADFRAVSRGRP